MKQKRRSKNNFDSNFDSIQPQRLDDDEVQMLGSVR